MIPGNLTMAMAYLAGWIEGKGRHAGDQLGTAGWVWGFQYLPRSVFKGSHLKNTSNREEYEEFGF